MHDGARRVSLCTPRFEAIVLARQPLTEQWLVDCLDACEAANANAAFH